ncbi:MAG TPA: hypothetical protein VHT73_09475 [Thermodesulfobacteriota bacterium]|nr:hypothetical protein [Thermodesulfobacteriota bacterium]
MAADEIKKDMKHITKRFKELKEELDNVYRQTLNPDTSAETKRELEKRAGQILDESNKLINEFSILVEQYTKL